MKQFITVLFIAVSIVANAQITTITPGATAPGFNLKNVDGNQVSFKTLSNVKGYIVVFTCNTCPYAQAYEERIIALNKKYSPLGFPVIAINPNDATVSPGDNFEKMQERAKAKKYTFPYLYDEGQLITNAYGAKNTPHIFLVQNIKDKNIVVYTGAIDNDPENNKPDKIN